MANANKPFGFIPIGQEGPIRSYPLASGLAQNIYKGDPVTFDANGKITSVQNATDDVIGIFVEVNYTDSTGSPQFRRRWTSGTATQGSKDAEALVMCDPHMHFMVQTSGTITQANVGTLADINLGTPSTAYETSRAVIDNIAGGQQVRINKIHPASEAGQYAVAECTWVNHVLGGSAQGTAT